MTNEMTPCGCCGMPCTAEEYHPYAACLMYKACRNSIEVTANLKAVLAHGKSSVEPTYQSGSAAAASYADAHAPVIPNHRALVKTAVAEAYLAGMAARVAHEPRASHGDGILDELEARGDDISKRAARYIRCKLAMLGDHPNRETT